MKLKTGIGIRSKIITIILTISIFPVLLTTYFFFQNFLSYQNEQSFEHYLTLMEQVSINVNYELDRYKKNIDDLISKDSFKKLLFVKQFNTALDEIKYDNDIGDEIRKNLIMNIDGDITLIQLDRKSILENSEYKSSTYSLGQYRIDLNRMFIDPLYLDVKENKEKNIAIGIFRKDVLIGYEAEKRSVILYPIRDENNEIKKLIVIILQPEYFVKLYSHLARLKPGTLFVMDFIGNPVSMNHPSSYDYFKYDKAKKIYVSDDGRNIDNDNMTLDDYNKLVLDPNILYTPQILGYLVDSGLETPLLKGSKTGIKNLIVQYKNTDYFTVGKVDNRTGMKFIFMISQQQVLKPATNFIHVILILSGLIFLALILILTIVNIIFLSPLEKAYIGLEEKNLYFMNLAHETKTPLTLIKNYLSRYIERVGLNDELVVVKQNLDKLERDMINILDARKLEQGKFIYNNLKNTNISELLKVKERLYKETAIKRDIIIQFSIQENIIVKGDPIAIDRIINNLIDNAIKYTPPKGSITITLSEIRDKAEFSVTDTGVGINKKDINRLFKPYSQIFNQLGNAKGVGLGLFITQNIIKELKGSLIVNSIPGMGTTFIVKLKTIKDATDRTYHDYEELSSNTTISTSIYENSLKETKEVSGRSNLLLIEDNPDLLFYIKSSLDEKYNIHYARNGIEASKILLEIKKPDLILSDIMMPEMDGFAFLKLLNENIKYKDIPLIFLSAVSDIDEKIRAYHNGAVDFINKPFSIDLLIARIESLLNFQLLKKELYEKDKYASLGMLLGGISHEIFNPLLGIYAPLENLEKMVETLDEKNKTRSGKYIKNIEDNVKRIENIVKSLKILYYNRNIDTEDIDIESIIKSIIEVFSSKLKSKIHLDYFVDPGFKLIGNHTALTQVLLNLVSNSIDAVPENGEIAIRAENDGKQTFLTITDNGCGIEDENLNNIFNAFFTTKEIGKGTGLGLYIVKDIVLRMGWNIEVYSKLNNGTTFKIIF